MCHYSFSSFLLNLLCFAPTSRACPAGNNTPTPRRLYSIEMTTLPVARRLIILSNAATTPSVVNSCGEPSSTTSKAPAAKMSRKRRSESPRGAGISIVYLHAQ